MGSRIKADRNRSPFFSRAYGGYTRLQEEFYRNVLGSVSGRSLLDPMGGQGFALSKLALEGADITLGDLNPAPLLLASLRDPAFIQARKVLRKDALRLISRLERRRMRSSPATAYVDDWIAPHTKTQIREFASLVGLDMFLSPFSWDADFWNAEPKLRFVVSLPVLAARRLTCFRTTDNVTWLKPGGTARLSNIGDAMRIALEEWVEYAEAISSRSMSNGRSLGRVITHRMNAEGGVFGQTGKMDVIVTSPPYANRLDYTRLWAPEIEVLATMCGASTELTKAQQIGTTVVEGTESCDARLNELPRFVRRVLSDIRDDGTEYSDIYYYPFFRNYALAVSRALRECARRLRRGGTFILFLRDTVRKDFLFPTSKMAKSVLTQSDVGLRLESAERRIIRQNIGFVRKASNRGIFGLAQQEWWLVFRRVA